MGNLQHNNLQPLPVTHDSGHSSDSSSSRTATTSESSYTLTDRDVLKPYSISIVLPQDIPTDDSYASLLRSASAAVNYRIRTGNFTGNVPGYCPGRRATFHSIIPVDTMEMVPASQHEQFLHRLLAMWLDAMMGLQAWGVKLSMPQLIAGQWALLN